MRTELTTGGRSQNSSKCVRKYEIVRYCDGLICSKGSNGEGKWPLSWAEVSVVLWHHCVFQILSLDFSQPFQQQAVTKIATLLVKYR